MSCLNITDTTKNLRDYVIVADNMLSSDICKNAINLFTKSDLQFEYHDTNGYSFTQLNITRHIKNSKDCKSMHDSLVSASLDALKYYKKIIPESSFWPDKTALEEFRIKRYSPSSENKFDDHIDAANLLTSKRYLVFFWYLNDVNEGGETQFPSLNLSVKPKAGRVLIFPPMWMFPHRANKAISNTKYMVGSYLHFI